MRAANLGEPMAATPAHDWWVVLVSGIIAMLFGILAIVLPHITLFVLILLFGIYALIDGISSLARAFSAGKRGQRWIWPTLGGIVGIVAGVIALVLPGVTAVALIYIIGAWAIVTGIFEIITGISMRHEISHEWLMILGGVISVIFGALVLARPGIGALAIVWLIGFFALVIGVQRIMLALRLRNLQEQLTTGTMPGTMPPAAV